MYGYKNLAKFTVRVANVGKVNSGKIIYSETELNHPWLERVEEEKPAPKSKKDD